MRNTGFSTAGQILSAIASTLVAVVTARLLGPSGRGEFAAAIAATGIVAVISLLGCSMATPSFLARGGLGGRGALKLAAALSLLGAAAMLAVHAVGANGLKLPSGTPEAWILASSAAAIVMGSMQAAAASGLGRLSSAAANQVMTTTATAVSLLVILPVVSPGLRLEAALGLWMVCQWAGDIVGWLLLLRSCPVAASSTRLLRREFARFAAVAYPGTIIGQLGFRLDIVLLPILATRADAGVYSLAVAAGSLVSLVPSALAQAIVSPLGSMDAQQAARMTRRAALAALAIASVTGLVILGVVSASAVPVLGGGYASLAGVFAVLLPGVVIFAPVHVLVGYANTALVRPHIASLVAGLWTSVDIVLLVLFEPRLGARGAALASSISYACGATTMLILTRRAAARR